MQTEMAQDFPPPFLTVTSRWPESLYSAMMKLSEDEIVQASTHVGGNLTPLCSGWGLQKWNQSLLSIIITTPQYGFLDNKLHRKLPKGTCEIRYNTIMVCPQVNMNM